jgi:hypothetical protein
LLIPKGRSLEVPPPWVFFKESAETKGQGPEKERKERSRARKHKEVKEIEETREIE